MSTKRIALPDRSAIEQSWYDHVATGDYTEDQQHTLVAALMAAYETEVNREIGEEAHDLESLDWERLLHDASIAVYDRYEQIERETLEVTD